MITHLLHREWQTTYCGKSTYGLRNTSTMAMVSCGNCYQVYTTLREIDHAKPEQFA